MKIKNAITTAHAVSLCILGAAMPSYAQDVEILLDDTTLGTSVVNGESVTSNGVTMIISGIVAANGGNTGDVEDWGILCGSDNSSSDVVSFGISFDVDVRITGYEIGAREDVPAGVSFVITGSNGSSGLNPVPEFAGFTETEIYQPYAPGTLPVLKAGEVYTLTHNLSDFSEFDALFNLEALYVAPISGVLEADVQFTGSKSGQITVQSEVGFTYSLRRSTDLVTDAEVSSMTGDGTPLVFSFDDSASSDSRAFFWIRRTEN